MKFLSLFQFDRKQLNDDELSFDFREQLKSELSNLQNPIIDNDSVYRECLNRYENEMENSVRQKDPYFSDNELLSLHLNKKGNMVDKVW